MSHPCSTGSTITAISSKYIVHNIIAAGHIVRCGCSIIFLTFDVVRAYILLRFSGRNHDEVEPQPRAREIISLGFDSGAWEMHAAAAAVVFRN